MSSRTKSSSSSSKKSKRPRTEPVAAEPVVETIVEETIVAEPVVETTEPAVQIIETYSDIRLLINEKERILKETVLELQRLNKKLDNAHKRESKKSKKVQRNPENKKEGKKHVVTDSLALLMGQEIGYECSRKEIQKFICKYVKENKLQEEGNMKCFNLDEPLREVLGEPQFMVLSKDGVSSPKHSYTNLMKTLSFLFKPDQL